MELRNISRYTSLQTNPSNIDRFTSPQSIFNVNDHDRHWRNGIQEWHDESYNTIPVRLRKKWPPPPTVEDETISLSREHSPVLSILHKDEVQEKGAIDQMPILFEIGKEQEIEQINVSSKRNLKEGQSRLSSDGSSNPETPADFEVSGLNSGACLKPNKASDIPLADSFAADTLRARSQPEFLKKEGKTYPARTNPVLQPPKDASLPRFPSLRENHTAPSSQHLSPGTLEELKAHPRETGYLGYGQRQRTMSGSDNAPIHRPANVRHMSALGYSGESETPSFPRDHPVICASSVNRHPRSMPPEFRLPKDHDHDAIVDSSDSDISPDEMDHNKTRYKSNLGIRNQPSHPHDNRPQLPSREQSKQYSQSPSPKRSSGSRTPVQTENTKVRQSELPLASKRSSTTSSPRSPYPSPPASPKPSSRPTSRDGSMKFIYPIISKQPQQQSQYRSNPTVSEGVVHNSAGHGRSNLRHSSRPSSPTEPVKTGRYREASLPHPPVDNKNGSRADLHETRSVLTSGYSRSLDPSPAPTSRSSRSPKPGLKVDVSYNGTMTGSRASTTLTPDVQHRPLSSDGVSKIFSPAPIVPMTATHWTSNEERILSISPGAAAEIVKHAKSNKIQQKLKPCSRPGYTAQYNDWWTIPAVPDLDLCPDCKKTLQDNGFSGSFVQSQARAPGTQTRCDLSVPWMRIAWLLILAGREKIGILRDVVKILSSEIPCPGSVPDVRPKWYRVYDEDAEKHIADWYVCPECIRSIRVLFPNLKESFSSHTSSSLQPRRCDLTASFTRFAKYIDLLDNSSLQARLYRSEPDIQRFLRLVKDFAGIRPCPRDNQFRGISWHYIHHMPDFTICQECFMEVVRPAQRAGFEVADQVSKKMALPYDANVNLSCQLYSPRMRAVFEECCQNRDIASLREHSMARVLKERELQHHAEITKMMPEDRRGQEMQRLIEEWIRWQ